VTHSATIGERAGGAHGPGLRRAARAAAHPHPGDRGADYLDPGSSS
jgi:hypothetical protein